MSDLREAAERLRRIKSGATPKQVYGDVMPMAFLTKDEKLVIDAYLAGPAWQDKPNAVGVWTFALGDRWLSEFVSKDSLNNDNWNPNIERFYGPIHDRAQPPAAKD